MATKVTNDGTSNVYSYINDDVSGVLFGVRYPANAVQGSDYDRVDVTDNVLYVPDGSFALYDGMSGATNAYLLTRAQLMTMASTEVAAHEFQSLTMHYAKYLPSDVLETTVEEEDGLYSATFGSPSPTPTKLATPDGLNVTNITHNESTLNWNVVTNASGYVVKYRKSGASSWTTQDVDS